MTFLCLFLVQVLAFSRCLPGVQENHSGACHKKSGWYHLYAQSSRSVQDTGEKFGPSAWKTIGSHGQNRRVVTQRGVVRQAKRIETFVPLPVGTKLHKLWKTWAALKASPKVIRMLEEGYTLPFQNRPNLTRSPVVISSYVHLPRNSYLMEALHALAETSNRKGQESSINAFSGFLQLTFLGSKTQQQMKTYPGHELSKQISGVSKIQNGDTKKYKGFLANRRMGNVHRFQRYIHLYLKNKPHSLGNTYVSRVNPTSSEFYHSACPLLQ